MLGVGLRIDPSGDSLMQKRRRPGLAATRPVLVAIPVRDEAEEIGPCLLALAAQRAAHIDAVVLCLNNCRDGTADVVRAIGDHLPFPVHSIEVALPNACCLGWAGTPDRDGTCRRPGRPGRRAAHH